MFGRKQITVNVVAVGLAARQVRPGAYEVSAGSTLKALLRRAGLPGRDPSLTFLIEGERVELDRQLADGETVTAILLVAGG